MGGSYQAIDAIFTKYEEVDVDLRAIEEPDRSVMLCVSAQSIIDKGGFVTFFEDDIEENVDYQWFVEAYRNVGMPELADNFSAILALFPDGVPHPELSERRQYLARFFDDESPEYMNILGSLENVFFDSNDQVYQAAEVYSKG